MIEEEYTEGTEDINQKLFIIIVYQLIVNIYLYKTIKSILLFVLILDKNILFK